jgi:NitT/TauT family transport system substrate-binding protein
MNYNIVYWMAADSSVPLKGATLGITGAGSTGEMIGKAVIAAKPESDIKLVVAGGLGAQWAAAKSKQISGAYSASPASTALEQEEGAAVLVAARDVIGDIPMDLVAVQKSYADKHAEAVKAFWRVIDRGYTYIREDTENAVTDLNKVLKMNPDVLLSAVKKEVESPLSYSIKVDCDALYNMSDVMIKGGAATEPVDWTKAIDQQYLPSEDRANCSGS